MADAAPYWFTNFLRFLFAVFLIVQGVLLNQYLVQFVHPGFYVFLIVYVIAFVVWILFTIDKIPIKHLWAVWATYVCIAFVPMLGTILGTVIYAYDEQARINSNGSEIIPEVRYLNKDEFLGPNVFKITLCLTPLLFLVLLTTTPQRRDRAAVVNLCMLGTLELFDGIEMLEVYIGAEREHVVPVWLKIVIACFTCFSFFVSPLEILESKADDCGVWKKRRRMFLVYALLQALLINGAYFLIRICLWLIYHMEASIFIAKNAITIIITLFEVFTLFKVFGFGADEERQHRQECIDGKKNRGFQMQSQTELNREK